MTLDIFNRVALGAAVTVATLSATVGAHAATLAGLKDGGTLVWIDTDKKAVTKTVKIKGASLVGIDVRPADGKLYGVTGAGQIVIVDPATGATTMKSQISEKLPAGGPISVDFNPAADRLRVIGADGTSLRINVEDGKAIVDGSLKYAESDAMKGKKPMAAAAAYTNSYAGTKETALYDIDAATGALVKQAPPNDGILNTIGMIGGPGKGAMAFDIWSDGKGGNVGWLVAGGKLHTVDLASGAAKAVGKVAGMSGKITDIAVMPAM